MTKAEIKAAECAARFEFDKEKRKSFPVICGIDEAGRGPWIGRVYAAAVVLDDSVYIDGINDSKKLSEKKREQLFDKITEKALSYSVAFAEVKEIEELNILQATFLAMKRAFDGLEGLKSAPDLVLVDGNGAPPVKCRVEAVVKGDSVSASIGAASILAKVSRDRYVKELDKLYPEFGFASNKGYGTAQHIAALKEYGITPVHRRSFLIKQEEKLGKFAEYTGKNNG